MPKISADQLITRGGNLQGAVPPSEKAGLDFAIEMTVDAINYHENGDETDPACCTGDNPCDTRIFLVKRQRELSAQIRGARDEQIQAEADEVRTQTRTGSGRIGAGQVADPASDKQVAFITRLAEEHDTSKIGTFPRRTLDAITGGSAHTVSKGRASRLIEVLTRQPKIQTQDEVRGPAASEAQMSFLRTLCEEQGQEVPENPTKAEASARISELLENRKGGQVRTPAKTSGVTEDGMYQTADGSVYKVQIAKQGSGRLYAKKLTEYKREDGTSEWSFEYAAGAIHRLKAADKMTLEQAQEFGKLYGVCCRCAADLTDEDSIARGMGPICAGKM